MHAFVQAFKKYMHLCMEVMCTLTEEKKCQKGESVRFPLIKNGYIFFQSLNERVHSFTKAYFGYSGYRFFSSL